MGLILDLRNFVSDFLGRPITQEIEDYLTEGLDDRVQEYMRQERDAYEALPQAERMQYDLRNYREGGVPRVAVISRRRSDTCSTCSQADGNEYSIAEALRLAPLPHPECTCEEGCDCVYRPLLSP